jgi:hypothetical protein
MKVQAGFETFEIAETVSREKGSIETFLHLQVRTEKSFTSYNIISIIRAQL